jgi:hypothetical protein
VEVAACSVENTPGIILSDEKVTEYCAVNVLHVISIPFAVSNVKDPVEIVEAANVE